MTALSFLAVATLCGLLTLPWDKSTQIPVMTAEASLPPGPILKLSSKKDIQRLFSLHGLNNLTTKSFELPLKDQVMQVETSLNPDLQNYLLAKMDRKNSRYIGIVVMEADTGRVLALAGFDKDDQNTNPCLSSEFPAASIFKIVTAAAAVDHCGLTANSKMYFNGYKHTLYKSQLKKKRNRYTNTVSFKNAFAQSVNPVFGKIGQLDLGATQLERFADAFGFNEPLDFELPLSPSHFETSDKPYYWAELASGFNNDTTMSPLHGAVMASAVLNEGRMAEPSIVDRIVGSNGDILYHGIPVSEQQAMSPEASNVLNKLMQTTIKSGTSRKSFRGYRRDKTLSRLEIGGKTGSIGNRTHDQRFDWFVGFATERKGEAKLAVAVMVAHQDYIGIRASRYARMAIKYYFRNCLVKNDQDQLDQDS
jgi:penicillin-binding protein A